MATTIPSTYPTDSIKSAKAKFSYGILAICFLFSFVVQYFIDYDSPLHYGFKHIDGAWFLMCGKAMMNGLVPYVDFTDSKGPLLWLFNGIGYLIYPRGYEGLYVLFSIYYSFILYFCYKTIRIAIGCSRNYALLATFAMSVIYFVWCHDEMRCEDLCQLPLIYSLYRLTLAIKQPRSTASAIAPFLIGIGIGCCIMIKWNQALLLCLIPLSLIVISWKEGTRPLPVIIYTLAGICCALLPWLVYFLVEGNLDAFIHEYFLNTFRTFEGSNQNFSETAATSLTRLLTSQRCIGLIFVIAPLYVFRGYGWKALLPSLCALCYLVMLTYVGADYYMTGMSSFAIFTMIAAVSLSQRVIPRLSNTLLVIASMLIIGLNAAYAIRYHMNFKYLNDYKNPEFFILNDMIASIPDARIMHFDYYEQGLGLTSRTLPACKYWSVQSGGESFSRQDQLSAITSRKPDFITVQSVEADKIDDDKRLLLERYGYTYIGSMKDYFGLRCNLYAKKEHGIKSPLLE